MKTIRWGILSTGNIANDFASDMTHVGNGELAAVASRNLGTARAFARKHRIPHAHEGYESILEDPEVDAIYVATPHNLHAGQSAAALRQGKAVLCEKPLTVNAEACRQLQEVANETGGYLMEAMWMYFLPAMRAAESWVRAGRIGPIRHIQAGFAFPFPYDPEFRLYNPDLAGGALLDLGIYPVALTWLMMRQDPTRIHVEARPAPSGVDEDFVAVFSFGDETRATLTSSLRCKLQNTAYIVGESGYIEIPEFFRAPACYLYQMKDFHDVEVDRFVDPRESVGLNFEAEAVGRDLEAGRTESERMPLATSLKLQEHMDAIRDQFRFKSA